jgi:hypothetical protein
MVRSDTVSSRLEWCFLRASYFASRGVAKRAVPREFVGCSVPVLSAQKPWCPQGFSHFWPIALAVCSAHATRRMTPAALHFASRSPNRVVFRVARVVKILGFLHGPVWHRSTSVEAVVAMLPKT